MWGILIWQVGAYGLVVLYSVREQHGLELSRRSEGEANMCVQNWGLNA